MMANPFDQFDTPSQTNPFDKFDQPTTQELVEKIPGEKPAVNQRQDVPYGEAAAKSGGLAGAIYGAARAARQIGRAHV